ncbi:hypothetical protein F5887DRAFT_1079506 [Amanita rubescens]|nr:hypothetical protein F5887DRAFT_1079506 [Amanita rubescens]
MASLNIRDEIQQLHEYLGTTIFNQRGKFSCYIVYRGRDTGVFNTWYMTHHSVNGISGNAYKGFHSRSEAEASYNDWIAFLQCTGVPPSATSSAPHTSPPAPPTAASTATRASASMPAPALLPTAAPTPGAMPAPTQDPELPRDSPSPTFSYPLILGGTPYYLVLHGERPGVYADIMAADDALGLAPDALIRRVFGEVDALRTFARLSEANQIHRI